MKKLIAIGAMLIASLAQAQDQATDEVAVAQQAINRHFDIWNDRNAAHWDAKLPQVYTADVLVADYGGLATGYADIRRLLQRVQADRPGFVFTPAPVAWNHGLGRVTWGYGPKDIYSITLYGDAGPATRFEKKTVLDNTPRALLKLRTDLLPQGEKFVVDKTKGYFDHLHSEHYTWHVARKDGKPIHLAELQFAFLLKATKQNQEPIFSIPLSTLRALLTAPEPLTHFLVDALSDAEPGHGGVHIPDLEIAAGLLELGVICVTSTRHMYALMDISVIG